MGLPSSDVRRENGDRLGPLLRFLAASLHRLPPWLRNWAEQVLIGHLPAMTVLYPERTTIRHSRS
jgi:hypothetical protein